MHCYMISMKFLKEGWEPTTTQCVKMVSSVYMCVILKELSTQL